MSKIIHCDQCNQILGKDAELPEGVKLQIRCFHCEKKTGKPVFIQIETKKEIKVEVKCLKMIATLLIPVYLYIGYSFWDPAGRVIVEMRNLFNEYAQD